LRDLLAKRQKPTEVENTTLAKAQGKASVIASASLFSHHIPLCTTQRQL